CEPQMMPKAGDEFAIVEFSLQAKRPAVQQLIVLLLLRNHVQMNPEAIHVMEHDLPLRELAYIEAVTLGPRRPWKHIIAVSTGVHCEKVHGIHVFSRQVVERSNDVFASPTLPRRVAGTIMLRVRAVMMKRLSSRLGVVERCIRQEIFRTSRAHLH